MRDFIKEAEEEFHAQQHAPSPLLSQLRRKLNECLYKS
jgi:hypothetical protein